MHVSSACSCARHMFACKYAYHWCCMLQHPLADDVLIPHDIIISLLLYVMPPAGGMQCHGFLQAFVVCGLCCMWALPQVSASQTCVPNGRA